MSPTAEPIHATTATCQDAGTLMATFGITQEPGPYVYGGHRYDKLTDAVHYAQRHLPRSAAPIIRDGAESQDTGTLMATFGITQEPGPYVYGGHRYDKLTDAVHYAQRHQASKYLRGVAREREAQPYWGAWALPDAGACLASRAEGRSSCAMPMERVRAVWRARP
jgi:hypothetical protein